MRHHESPPTAPDGAAGGQAEPRVRRRPGRAVPAIVATVLAVLAAVAAMALTQPASAVDKSAASAPNAATSTQRGPDPTISMIEATRGPFATAQLSVAPGNGFNGGTVYYPTDTSQGTWGALAIVPGYSALFANEEAWMGPWLSSFGFVVIGVETNSRSDDDNARASELLSALTWLTTQSPVKDRVDPNRLSVLGHSAGGAGAIRAAERQPSLRAMIGLAPGFPGNSLSMATDHVPTLIIGGQNDGTVTPSYLSSLYGTLPASTQSAFAQIAGADHVYYTHANNVEMKLLIPWLKIFLDSDTRYTQFLCPSLPDPSTISAYQPKCPYVPPGGTTTGGTTTGGTTTGGTTTGGTTTGGTTTGGTTTGGTTTGGTTTGGTTTGGTTTGGTTTGGTTTGGTTTGGTGNGACSATYSTTNSWSGGFQGQVTVTAGSAAISGWTVKWTLAGGQTVTQVWNGTLTTSGSTATVTNASYNGSLAAGGSTTFGFLANGSPSTPTLTCTSP
ncbi:cellulose-binding domain-containing protein [Streptomyces sp. HPF1205]|uniref:cellulose-binding domain-containing protein n=1 Tax=Streptomyces sp. HPF1205 TaxID=2873262 RepID=UPI001CED7F4D|nr:cellulose-binding domain-containing protein [Streptomyces sp. HPF1205]